MFIAFVPEEQSRNWAHVFSPDQGEQLWQVVLSGGNEEQPGSKKIGLK